MAVPAKAQVALSLRVAEAEGAVFAQNIQHFSPKFIRDGGVFTATFADSVAMRVGCLQLVEHFKQGSYFAFSIDDLKPEKVGVWAGVVYVGPRYFFAKINWRGDVDWVEAEGFDRKLKPGKVVQQARIQQLQRRIVEAAENTGYPMVRVALDSVLLDTSGGVQAQLTVHRGPLILLDGLNIKGNVGLPKGYLSAYLGLKKGTPYNAARIAKARQRLQELIFAGPSAAPTVTFSGKTAAVNVFLEKKKANRFDFLIGLLPQPENEKKLLLTGSITADFYNALGQGERLSAQFERLKPETQKMDILADFPYLLGTPLGVEGRINLFRRDSTATDAVLSFGVRYFLDSGDGLKLFWEKKSSSLQVVDTVAVKASKKLPANLDFRQNQYGLELTMRRLDYRYNPRKGYQLTARVGAGFHEILRNSAIESLTDSSDPTFRYAGLYDSIATKAVRWKAQLQADYFIPVGGRSTLKSGVQAGGIFSKKPILNNEQFRLGGNRVQRGFDEESLFASRYAIGTLEYRLLISQNAYIFAFVDAGYIENETVAVAATVHPLGTGGGLTFETPAGIFGISIAVGRRDDETLDWRAAKFHLGYVSRF